MGGNYQDGKYALTMSQVTVTWSQHEPSEFLTTEPSVVKNDSLILSSVTFWEFEAKYDLALR